MTKPKLPPHIAAALSDAGGPADSANRPWAGRDLGHSGETVHQYENDDGRADENYRTALGELAAGTGTEAGVVAALATMRVFAPIVAEATDTNDGTDGIPADKESDMALVSLRAPDGRKALPVFSSVQYLQAWHPQARPVAVPAPRAALSAAAEDAQLMVLDPGAPQTFVVRRPATWALAHQRTWTPSYLDDQVRQSVELAANSLAPIQSVQTGAGSGVTSLLANGRHVNGGGPGPELCISLVLAPGMSETDVRAIVDQLQNRLTSDEEFVERVDSLEIKLISGN